ncbi:MAG: TIGR03943 family putative permease subunit [Actinomycetota bacterium]
MSSIADRPRLSSRRLVTTLVLGAWCALFWYLMISGQTALYLSSRTDWVVPVGAFVLTGATIARLLSLREHDPAPLTPRDAAGVGLVLLPVVVMASMPAASLDSYAASRRSSIVGGSYVSSAEDITDGELTLVDVGGALRSREAMRALAERAGAEVSFVGFVTRDSGDPADEFTLTRFMISCCVADALSVEVRVVGAPPGRFAKDDWVEVTGKLYPLGTEVVVDASEVVSVPRPKRPYLNP